MRVLSASHSYGTLSRGHDASCLAHVPGTYLFSKNLRIMSSELEIPAIAQRIELYNTEHDSHRRGE